MINYLQDCQKSTPIGMVPDIINHNNQAINDEFAWIYDATLDRLTKSVYAPSGSVKAHKGEFVNLSCEYLTVKNVNALKTYIQDVVKDIVTDNLNSHNTIDGRYSLQAGNTYDNTNYTHDAASIVYDDQHTVYDIIDLIDNGNIKIKYNNTTYTAEDIAKLIDWKNSLEVKTLTIDSSTYNVLCEK